MDRDMRVYCRTVMVQQQCEVAALFVVMVVVVVVVAVKKILITCHEIYCPKLGGWCWVVRVTLRPPRYRLQEA